MRLVLSVQTDRFPGDRGHLEIVETAHVVLSTSDVVIRIVIFEVQVVIAELGFVLQIEIDPDA